jgi:hypothetical protein
MTQQDSRLTTQFRTDSELTVWIMAYTSNQPQVKDDGKRESALYWAAAAVFRLRHAPRNPTDAECKELFEAARVHIYDLPEDEPSGRF